MTNVTRNNFEELLPEIISCIEKSEFVAIDGEFTGLHYRSDSYNSLFDTPQDRYDKLRETASQFTLCQLGLSAFVKEPDENKYVAHIFNFYIFPRSCSTIDARFSCQASSIQFLCQHGFDFNKFFYEGVSYLTLQEEKELRQQVIEDPSLLLSDVDDNLTKNFSSIISGWLSEAKDGDQISMAKLSSDIVSIQAQLMLRGLFPTIWTAQVNTGEILVTKVSLEDREAAAQKEQPLAERLLDKLFGFNKVFSCLCELKKPVIGHNCLTDLLFLHSKFYKPLPERFTDFKSSLHQLLPHIYDTKHLLWSLKKNLDELGLPLVSTSLEIAYRLFDGNRGKFLVLHSPSITLAPTCCRYKEKEALHEAGFDSYLAGYVFLRMAHYIAAKDIRSTETKPLPFVRYLQALTSHRNRVNVIRARVPYVNLADADPPSNRPSYLHITSRGSAPLNAGELAAMFERHTSVDVKLIDKRHALLAASTRGGTKDILRAFKHNETISVVHYNMFQHSKPVRYSLWGAVVVMTTLCAWALLGGQPRRS